MAAALSLIAVGGFGKRTAELLSARHPGSTTHPARAAEEAFRAPVSAVVLVLENPRPSLCEQMDDLGHHHGRTWLPVVMDNTVIRVGPLVRPTHAPCSGCFQARGLQHDREAAATALLHRAYDAGELGGPGGFLPHHARLAAAVATASLRHAATPPGPDGTVVTTVRLREWRVDHDRIVPVHGCPRCGPRPGEAGRSADGGLRRALADAAAHRSEGGR